MGPKGHGKTTLLEHLERRLAAQGFEIRRHPTQGLHEGVVISIDGLDLLRPFARWRLRRSLRTAAGLLATSHRPGRLPTLYEHRSTPELLRELVRELLNDADFQRVHPRLDELFARHSGNVRECLRDLYDKFAMDKRRNAPWR